MRKERGKHSFLSRGELQCLWGILKFFAVGDHSKFLPTTLENYFPEADPGARWVYRGFVEEPVRKQGNERGKVKLYCEPGEVHQPNPTREPWSESTAQGDPTRGRDLGSHIPALVSHSQG